MHYRVTIVITSWARELYTSLEKRQDTNINLRMDRVTKYTQYFTAQADGKIPLQRGGMFGGLLTLDNALNWVNKFCDIATDTVQVISPI